MVEFILLFFVGIFVGIYASVVGGGALVLVPFFSLIGTPLVTAIATTRVGATVQELVSAIAFWRKKAIEWKSALWMSIWSMVGAFLGAQIVIDIDKRMLAYIIAGTMIALLFLIPKIGKQQKTNGSPPSNWLLPFAITGFLLGIYGGFYGAGFGTFIIFFFTLFGGTNLLIAVGNARVIGFFMSIAASYVFLEQQLVDWQLFIPITAGMVFGSWIGVHFAVKFGNRWITMLLIIVVLASVIKLLIDPT